jgi:GNAT superfamily N-acetyltransferase
MSKIERPASSDVAWMPERIRPAVPDDGERLREIAIAAKSYWGYDPARVGEWAAVSDYSQEGLRRKEVYVAEVGGQAVGWAAAIDRGDVLWLDDLWIDPEWMRKGIGTRLFHHAVARGRQLGAVRMEWEAERHALGFYEKIGGRYLRDGEPGVWGRVSPVMGLDLV